MKSEAGKVWIEAEVLNIKHPLKDLIWEGKRKGSYRGRWGERQVKRGCFFCLFVLFFFCLFVCF